MTAPVFRNWDQQEQRDKVTLARAELKDCVPLTPRWLLMLGFAMGVGYGVAPVVGAPLFMETHRLLMRLLDHWEAEEAP